MTKEKKRKKKPSFKSPSPKEEKKKIRCGQTSGTNLAMAVNMHAGGGLFWWWGRRRDDAAPGRLRRSESCSQVQEQQLSKPRILLQWFYATPMSIE
jgi:hypothetical protein